MAKITKKEIVDTQDTKENPNVINPVSVVVGSKRLLDTSDTSVSNKLAAMILTEAVIKELKDHLENLSEQLENTSYDDITKALIDEGVLAPGETPVISVVDKKGNKISKVLTSTTKNDLVYDTFKALAKDDTFFAELPDEYKKIDIQGKPFFSSLYKADAIDPKYKKYFSMEENTVTGLKAIKMGDK